MHGLYFNQKCFFTKSKNQFSDQKLSELQSKIVHLKEIYNFDFDHFLIKRTVFVLIVINVIKNQKFNFPDKLCDIQKKC